MKIVSMPIEMIAHFEKNGTPHPLRFKIISEDEMELIVTVDRVIQHETEKLAGNRMIVYRCQSQIKNTNMVYELKYEINTCKWILFKM